MEFDITLPSENGPVRYYGTTDRFSDIETIARVHGIVLYCEVPPHLLRDETSFSVRVDAVRGPS